MPDADCERGHVDGERPVPDPGVDFMNQIRPKFTDKTENFIVLKHLKMMIIILTSLRISFMELCPKYEDKMCP
jgi:hypothetical protein